MLLNKDFFYHFIKKLNIFPEAVEQTIYVLLFSEQSVSTKAHSPPTPRNQMFHP